MALRRELVISDPSAGHRGTFTPGFTSGCCSSVMRCRRCCYSTFPRLVGSSASINHEQSSGQQQPTRKPPTFLVLRPISPELTSAILINSVTSCIDFPFSRIHEVSRFLDSIPPGCSSSPLHSARTSPGISDSRLARNLTEAPAPSYIRAGIPGWREHPPKTRSVFTILAD